MSLSKDTISGILSEFKHKAPSILQRYEEAFSGDQQIALLMFSSYFEGFSHSIAASAYVENASNSALSRELSLGIVSAGKAIYAEYLSKLPPVGPVDENPKVELDPLPEDKTTPLPEDNYGN